MRCASDSGLKSDGRIRFLKLSRQPRHISLDAGDLLLQHILDDVNCVGFDINDDAILSFQSALWQSFEVSGLPTKAAKSTPLNLLEKDHLPFISYEWDMRRGLQGQKLKRLEAVSQLQDFW